MSKPKKLKEDEVTEETVNSNLENEVAVEPTVEEIPKLEPKQKKTFEVQLSDQLPSYYLSPVMDTEVEYVLNVVGVINSPLALYLDGELVAQYEDGAHVLTVPANSSPLLRIEAIAHHYYVSYDVVTISITV